MGAITTEAQNDTILSYIEKGQAEGAEITFGSGKIKTESGQFVGPVIFENVRPEMSIFRDEIFGPVISVTPFDTVEEAIMLANDTEYGLAASVWSKNVDKVLQVSRNVQAGRFWANTTLAGGPRITFRGLQAIWLGT